MKRVIIALLWPLLSFAVTTNTNRIGPTKYLIQYDFKKMEISDAGTIEGKNYKQIKLQGNFLPAKPGTPNIPVVTKYIAIPKGASINTRIIHQSKGQIHNIRIAPSPKIQNDNNEETMGAAKDPTIYAYDQDYPTKPLESSTKTIRGLDVAEIIVSAGQHNPVKKTFTYYKSLTLEIEVSAENEELGNKRLRSYWWDPIIKDIIENPEDLPPVDLMKRSTRSDQDFEYIIIIPPSKLFEKYAGKLKEFRTLQGIRTGIVTTDQIGGNNTNSIKKYIHDAYNNWEVPPVAVLLLGDVKEIRSPLYNQKYHSDNIYADVTGDHLPDMVLARISAKTKSDLKNSINKIINFEKKPPTGEHYYQTATTATGWEHKRWFQIGTESINGFYEQILGKDIARLYTYNSGSTDDWSSAANTESILNYFGKEGLGYIPDNPEYLTDWDTTADDINDAINEGTFLLIHRGHGKAEGWIEPKYTTSQVLKLKNKDPTFILSINCLTGKFDHKVPSFAETMLRHKKAAVGVIAASYVSQSFVNDAMVWGLYDFMWPSFLPELGKDKNSPSNLMPAFALASGKYFLQRSSWPKSEKHKQETYHLFHYHGDAFTRLHWQKPRKLNVIHKRTIAPDERKLTIEAERDSFIALTRNGNIIATAHGAQATLELPVLIPGDKIVLTITGQNRLRYQKSIRVKLSSTPLVVLKDQKLVEEDKIEMTLSNISLLFARGFSLELKSLSKDATIRGPKSQKVKTLLSLGSTTITWDIAINKNVAHQKQLLFMLTTKNSRNEVVLIQTFKIEAQAPKLELAPTITGRSDIGHGETRTIGYTLINNGGKIAHDIDIIVENDGIAVASHFLERLEAGQKQLISLPITFDSVTPQVQLSFKAIPINTPMIIKKHLITLETTEDFEQGHFVGTGFGYAEVPWIIEQAIPFAGQYSVRSGRIYDHEKSILAYKVNLPKGGTISFMKKISSQRWDTLTFYIDKKFTEYWDGEHPWSQSEYDLPAGEYLLKWVYKKNGEGSAGADGAFLDNIVIRAN